MRRLGDPPAPVAYSGWTTIVLFLLGAAIVGGTVAGPGLAWDEPAYRHSQVTLQHWLSELWHAPSWAQRADLFSKDAITVYWEFNRFGHNFHPPMASYLNLATFALAGSVWDDIAARRLASALEFAAVVAILGHFIGRRYGTLAGVFAALSLLTMPRLLGDAHLIGTDMPLLFFWVLTALTFARGLTARPWQVLCACCFACLFLVKFSGLVIVAPLGIWFLLRTLPAHPWPLWQRWLAWTAVMVLPLVPAAATVLGGVAAARSGRRSGALSLLADFGLDHPRAVGAALFWPALVWGWFLWRQRRPRDGTLPAGRSLGARWDVGLELPWVILALTPLVAIALNPTWWHDTLPELAQFFDLNFARRGKLPDIGIFYLGRRYFYSLPWHNAYVLMAVTLPPGALLLGLVGCGTGLWRYRNDPVPLYFLLHALALPVSRMFHTPAHDGVRLFLPTFFFWAGLAGIGAATLAVRGATRRKTARRLLWAALFFAGPGWAAVDWLRIHPYELSYYNLGLRRAVDLGFEPTYWYEAVTPGVLRELNATLPRDATVTVYVDPLINSEVFSALQELGRLRSDIRLNQPPDAKRFAWVWLLTHSSKATAFTRLLYACKPWREFGHDGVRLFSVIDDRSVALAYALWLLTVEDEDSSVLGSLRLHQASFQLPRASLRQAVGLVKAHGPAAVNHLEIANGLGGDDGGMRSLVELLVGSARRPEEPNTRYGKLAFLLREYPDIMDRAITILTERPRDLLSVLETDGYQLPDRFGGYFEP